MSAPPISAAPTHTRRHGGNIVRRFVAAHVEALGTHDFRGVIATSDLQSDGLALVIEGGNFERFQDGRGPFIDNHNPRDVLGVIKRLESTPSKLYADGRFTDANDLAKQRRRELKDGVANYFSIGFMVDASEPMRGGERVTRWTLLEVSLTSLPVDPKAIVTARSRRRGVPMQTAVNHCQAALDEHQAFGRHHAEIADAAERLDEHRSRLGTALRGLHAAVQADDKEEQAADCHARCMRCLGGMHREMKAIGDRHQDAQDAFNSVNRALRSAGDILELGTQGEPTAGSAADHHGRSGDADYRRRRFQALKLSIAAEEDPGSGDRDRRQRELRKLELATLE